MKIKQAIKELKAMKKKYGNIGVMLDTRLAFYEPLERISQDIHLFGGDRLHSNVIVLNKRRSR